MLWEHNLQSEKFKILLRIGSRNPLKTNEDSTHHFKEIQLPATQLEELVYPPCSPTEVPWLIIKLVALSQLASLSDENRDR